MGQTSLAGSPAVKEKFFYQTAAIGVVMTKIPFGSGHTEETSTGKANTGQTDKE